MDELIVELKEKIIVALNLDHLTAKDISSEAPLFGGGLGLDSIDALELIVLLERDYGIRLQNPAQGKAIFASIETMARYVAEHRKK